MAAPIHGKPIPRKTLTELLPVTFTIEASAHSSCTAAVLDAKRSGTDVPSATKVMAVISSSMSAAQPKSSARSPMMRVSQAMCPSEQKKQTQPPAKAGGGVESANRNCHGNQTACVTYSPAVGPSWAAVVTWMASLIWSHQRSKPSLTSLTFPMLSRNMVNLVRRRPSGGTELMMFTVRQHLSGPPSLFGLNSRPPVASSRTIWKLSFCSPIDFGRTEKVMSTMETPSLNTSSPSCST
mmetsp:Transcript_73284/g.169995  ORF Transcript_73284/g.169995 Transcript_73284/m.169995 type:complete len:238 (+) Transcript_73284:606-1319(+)